MTKLNAGKASKKMEALELQALKNLDKTTFKDGLRVIPKSKITIDEFDFRDLTKEEESFAVMWEYMREHEKFYIGHWKLNRDGKTRSYRPAGGRGMNGLHWSMNNQFFPLSISMLKRKKLWKFYGNPLPPAFEEMSIIDFKSVWEDLSHPIWNETKQFGTDSFSKVAFKRTDFKPGVMPAAIFRGRLREEGHLDSFSSMHCIRLDWRRGSKAIQREIETWVKKMSHLACVPCSTSIRRLNQLGAWRARRAGLRAEEYLKIRMEAFGYKSASEMKKEHENYEDPSTFRNAAKKAEEFLKTML